jgi:hypothetical protein
MEHSTSSEANSRAPSQISRSLWDLKVHYRVHSSCPAIGLNQGQINPIHNITPCFFKIHFNIILPPTDSSVGIALGYGLDDRGSRVRFPAGAGSFSLHRVQNGSGAHPASYPMGTRGSFPGGKAAGAWSWPLTFI